MAQVIRNIKAGQKFKIVDNTLGGFEIDCIVEALNNIENVEGWAGHFKWIGGYKPSYVEDKNIALTQNVQDLKRFKGKIK